MVEGEATVVVENGIILEQNLAKLRLSIDGNLYVDLKGAQLYYIIPTNG